MFLSQLLRFVNTNKRSINLTLVSHNCCLFGLELFPQLRVILVISLHGDLSESEKDIADTLVIIVHIAVVDNSVSAVFSVVINASTLESDKRQVHRN